MSWSLLFDGMPIWKTIVYHWESNMARTLTGLISLVLLAISLKLGQINASNSTYTNPILDGIGADPWVIKHQDYYYMTYSTNDNITILRSGVLTDWNSADVKLVFKPPVNTTYSYDLWAPELHQINDQWYIIFTADVDADSPRPEEDMLCDYTCPAVNHRMFVLESSCSDPWESNYTMKAELDTYDQFAIDGTYLQVNGELYHVYSCWYDKYVSWPAMLCISKSELGRPLFFVVIEGFGTSPFCSADVFFSDRSLDGLLTTIRARHNLQAHECVGEDAIQPYSQRSSLFQRRSPTVSESFYQPDVHHLQCREI